MTLPEREQNWLDELYRVFPDAREVTDGAGADARTHMPFGEVVPAPVRPLETAQESLWEAA